MMNGLENIFKFKFNKFNMVSDKEMSVYVWREIIDIQGFKLQYQDYPTIATAIYNILWEFDTLGYIS